MNRLMLNKATSSSEEPTPGYLFNEISHMAFSSKESLVLVGDYLIKKLKRTDLNVKLKTLKILKHLCDEQRQDFRNYLKKKIDVIKECQTCNIVNDELKGETPSILVRKEATDLIKLIYSYDIIEPSVKGTTTNDSILKKNRIEGFGNTLYEKKPPQSKRNNRMLLSYNSKEFMNKNTRMQGSESMGRIPGQGMVLTKMNNELYKGNSSTKNTNTKLSGFGNPYFNQNPPQKTKGEIAIKYINEVAKNYIPSSFVNKIEKVSASISKNYSNGTLSLQSIMDASNYNTSKESDTYRNRKLNNTGMQENSYPRGIAYPPQVNHVNNVYQINQSGSKKRLDKIKKPQESQESGIYERKVIDDVLSTTGGIKKIPSEQVLFEFAQKCDALDTKLIVSIITERLKMNQMKEEDMWKHKLKLLCIIEYLINHRKKKEEKNERTIETLESLIDNLKYQTMEELYRCKNWKELKRKVNDIFVLMGLQEKATIEIPKKEQQVINVHQKYTKESMEIPNLLDFDDEPNLDRVEKANERIPIQPKVKMNKNNSVNNIFYENTSSKNIKEEEHFNFDLDHVSPNNNSNNLFSNLNVKYTGTTEQESTLIKANQTRMTTNEKYEKQENKREKELNLEMLNDSFSNMYIQYNNNKNNNNQSRNNNNANSNELISFDELNEQQGKTDSTYLYKRNEESQYKDSNNLFDHCEVKNVFSKKMKPKENKWNDLSDLQNLNELNLIDISANELVTPALDDFITDSKNETTEEKKERLNQHNFVESTQWNNTKTQTDGFLKRDKNEDTMNHFLNSFSMTSKNDDSCNMKQNVNIDAFELLSDQLKL